MLVFGSRLVLAADAGGAQSSRLDALKPAALLDDLGYLVSAPTRIDRGGSLRMLVFAGATALMVSSVDKPFDEEFGIERGGHPLGLPHAMTHVGEFYDRVGSSPFTLAVTGGAAIFGIASGNEYLLGTAGMALEAVVFTNLFTQMALCPSYLPSRLPGPAQHCYSTCETRQRSS